MKPYNKIAFCIVSHVGLFKIRLQGPQIDPWWPIRKLKETLVYSKGYLLVTSLCTKILSPSLFLLQQPSLAFCFSNL